jgi:hypothetical protein
LPRSTPSTADAVPDTLSAAEEILSEAGRNFYLSDIASFRPERDKTVNVQEMDMIGPNIAADYIHFVPSAYFRYNFTKAQGDITLQHIMTVFCFPHKMVFEIRNSMRTPPVSSFIHK